MNTFLVRVWVPADDTGCGTALRGVVRHVATGVERPFSSDEEVLCVLRSAMTRRLKPAGRPTVDVPNTEVAT